MEVPAPYKTAGLVNLVCGGFGVMVNLMWVLAMIWVCVGILWLIPAAASGYQAYIGWQMYNGEPSPAAKNAAIAGIVAGVFGFNIVSLAGSAFAMMQVGNDEVKGWLEQHGAA
ncbi:MAG: hypothetical protein R3F59_15510 [Myxococcota bacterium]